MVDEQLSEARVILGARVVHRTAEVLGCDLVLVPAHELFPGRLAPRYRSAGCVRVIAVRAG